MALFYLLFYGLALIVVWPRLRREVSDLLDGRTLCEEEPRRGPGGSAFGPMGEPSGPSSSLSAYDAGENHEHADG